MYTYYGCLNLLYNGKIKPSTCYKFIVKQITQHTKII